MQKTSSLILLSFIALFYYSCQDEKESVQEDEIVDIPEYLPMSLMNLEDLTEFKTAGEDWKVVGGVLSDFSQDWDLTSSDGEGMLINASKQGSQDGVDIYTKMEHGDLLLELDFLLPKAAASGLYFMSRYELALSDTYNAEALSSANCGGISAPVISSDANRQIINGKAPNVNAAKAPGLWQNFRILFRAPRFDSNGKKTDNAKFEYVYHNGYLIHENVELSAPSGDADSVRELSKAPLRIQGDQGPVAIKNIRYKAYENDTVAFSDITYKVYSGEFSEIPDYSTLAFSNTGKAASFATIEDLSDKSEGYAVQYEGSMVLPFTGKYLIETVIDDGGNLYLDDSLAVNNEGDPGASTARIVMDMTAGKHTFKVDCYARDKWGTRVVFNIEGPNMQKRSYLSNSRFAMKGTLRQGKTMNVDADNTVEMIRGFVDHRDKKYTHILSVGHPASVHFSYDTRNNALLNVWKGDFADVNEMWEGRGVSQKLKPRNAVLPLNSGIPIVGGNAVHDPGGFSMADDGHPVFNYTYDKIKVTDDIICGDGYVTRTLSFENNGSAGNYKIAKEKDILSLNEKWKSIGSQYNVAIDQGKDNISIQKNAESDQLLYKIPKGKSTLTYRIFW
ncbi:MAG: hypothetical protein ACJA01_003267 [Saprospiraceae bacterium]|jgi:hypothetical protein